MANKFLNYDGLNTVISKLKNYIDNLFNNLSNGKVDKETGYGLSKNNFTDDDKSKLSTLDTAPTSNSNNLITSGAVYTALQTVSNSIPTIPENVSAFNNDAGYLTEHQSLENYTTLDSKQTIKESKTFESDLYLKSKCQKGDNTIEYTDFQSLYIIDNSNDLQGINHDNSKARFGVFETSINPNVQVKSYLRAYKNEANSTDNIELGVCYKNDGTSYAYAPNPSSTSNDNNIATTSWVRSLIKVEKLSSNTTASDVLSNKTLISLYIGWVSSGGSGCYIWAEQKYENAEFYLQSGGSKTINMGSPLSSLVSMGGITFAVMVYI